mgnify:FL=1
METILEFQNVSYAYHTLDGETPALSHISFSVKKRRIYCYRRSIWLRKIHTLITDRRAAPTGGRADSDPWKIRRAAQCQHWVYASERSPV